MRVLTVGNMYPPHHFGGYELVWMQAVRTLRERGHEVRVLTSDFDSGATDRDDPDVHRELEWYWRDHVFPRLSLRARLRRERHNATVLDRHLAELRPDVVSWWSMGGMSLGLIERVRAAGLPAVAFVHDDWLIYAPRVDGWLATFTGARRHLAALVERLTGLPTGVELGRAARYVFVSESVRRGALAAIGGLEDTAIAHSGIDPAFLASLPSRPWSWKLLYVGRLDARKGIDTAIEALAELPAQATLTVIGASDPGERERLERLALTREVRERVEFLGAMETARLPTAYAGADALVFPVRWEEPWGLVPLEAMGMGTPVVATGRGGSAEYLRDGENCLLFDAGDASALTRALLRLGADAELREVIRRGGLETAPQHTQDHFDAAVEAELLRAARSTPCEPRAQAPP
ncbi:MAG: hypothetical protein NVSMB25_03050 [Thermoleophilaceae bacterium]